MKSKPGGVPKVSSLAVKPRKDDFRSLLMDFRSWGHRNLSTQFVTGHTINS